MSDLVRVVGKDGVETVVGREWLTRWPDDFTEVEPETPTPVGGKETADSSAPTAPTGRNKKEQS